MHMLDTSFIHVHTAWQVTTKDHGDAYDKAMTLVLSCIQDDLPTEPRTTRSASQQVCFAAPECIDFILSWVFAG